MDLLPLRYFGRQWRFACWPFLFLFLLAFKSGAQDFRLESTGARLGFGSGELNSDFLQSEAFVDWDLPWHWNLGNEWRLQTRLDISLGWLGETGSNGLNGIVGTAGPLLTLSHGRFPVFLEGGVSPTGLSRYDYATKDLGMLFQFTTHLGVGFDISSHLRLSYRYQHMSNAGLSPSNPGLNMQVFGVSYVF